MGVEIAQEVEEKKPDRPPSKSPNSIYPVLNKYSEKTASVKELTTSKISLHKENTLSKESTTQSTVTHTNKSESEKLIHSESITETGDGQVKKPPVPLKKSPTPTSGVGGLFSGLKNKMLSSTDKEKSAVSNSGSSSGGEWDRADGAVVSRTTVNNNTSTFDHVERNSILNDPRAGRVKAPRRRPPSQALRDDTPQQLGLSNGHDEKSEKPVDKAEAIKPRAREWEKHKAPWMEELKLNQAKKTGFEGKPRSASGSEPPPASKGAGGSTDRILEIGLEEKRSTHSMEMSKSTSSISNRMSLVENYEETKVRNSLNSKKEGSRESDAPVIKPVVHSPTAAGRTLTTMLDEIKKPPAPGPPAASVRTSTETTDKSPNAKIEKTVISTEKQTEVNSVSKLSGSFFEKASTIERIERMDEKPERPVSVNEKANTLERRLHKVEKLDGADALIAQLNNRITNLEKLLELQNLKFNAAIEELTTRLTLETEKRQSLQAEVEKLAHCVTQV